MNSLQYAETLKTSILKFYSYNYIQLEVSNHRYEID